MHGRDNPHAESNRQQLIDIFDAGILVHCPFEVDKELIPVDVAILVHVDFFQRVL